MARLVEQGKVRYLGLSEAGAKDDSACLQDSSDRGAADRILTLEPRSGGRDLAVCREEGVGFVAYSPLGRGFLTGQIRRFEDFAADDFRRMSPRFQGDNFNRNLALVDRIKEFAADKRLQTLPTCPRVGTRAGRGHRDDSRDEASDISRGEPRCAEVKLTADDLKQIDAIAPRGVAAGDRYPAATMSVING